MAMLTKDVVLNYRFDVVDLYGEMVLDVVDCHHVVRLELEPVMDSAQAEALE